MIPMSAWQFPPAESPMCADSLAPPIAVAAPGWDDLPCVRTGQVWLADGNQYFSRPGPRLVESLELLAAALHPEHPGLANSREHALHLDAVKLGMQRRQDNSSWATG